MCGFDVFVCVDLLALELYLLVEFLCVWSGGSVISCGCFGISNVWHLRIEEGDV